MGNLARFHTADLPALLDRINKNSIGVDEYINRLFEFCKMRRPVTLHTT